MLFHHCIAINFLQPIRVFHLVLLSTWASRGFTPPSFLTEGLLGEHKVHELRRPSDIQRYLSQYPGAPKHFGSPDGVWGDRRLPEAERPNSKAERQDGGQETQERKLEEQVHQVQAALEDTQPRPYFFKLLPIFVYTV